MTSRIAVVAAVLVIVCTILAVIDSSEKKTGNRNQSLRRLQTTFSSSYTVQQTPEQYDPRTIQQKLPPEQPQAYSPQLETAQQQAPSNYDTQNQQQYQQPPPMSDTNSAYPMALDQQQQPQPPPQSQLTTTIPEYQQQPNSVALGQPQQYQQPQPEENQLTTKTKGPPPPYAQQVTPYPSNGDPEMPGTQAAADMAASFSSGSQLLYSSQKNILALGGSTTWGSKLEDRNSAFPFLLEQKLGSDHWSVYNLAVRATDASYAAQCIESMIREGVDVPHVNFDVILLEYSLNGLDGMPLLLKRLRRRFPSATIIYVHLWALRMMVDNAVTGAKPRDELNKGLKFVDADKAMNDMLNDPQAQWAWAPKMYQDSVGIAEEALSDIEPAGGHVLQLPMPESPQQAFDEHWFGPDFHHLSEVGHEIVANEIVKLLQNPSVLISPREDSIAQQWSDSSWGDGDLCYSWYETGSHADVKIEGGTVKMFVKPNKYALHVGLTFGQPAKIFFPNSKKNPTPIMLMLMSWGEGVYPKSRIDVESPGFAPQSSILDPLHPNPLNHVFHVTRTAHVGWANPGESVVTVEPIEDQQRPLRIVGIVMCAACLEMDAEYLSNEASHQRLKTEIAEPWKR